MLPVTPTLYVTVTSGMTVTLTVQEQRASSKRRVSSRSTTAKGDNVKGRGRVRTAGKQLHNLVDTELGVSAEIVDQVEKDQETRLTRVKGIYT